LGLLGRAAEATGAVGAQTKFDRKANRANEYHRLLYKAASGARWTSLQKQQPRVDRKDLSLAYDAIDLIVPHIHEAGTRPTNGKALAEQLVLELGAKDANRIATRMVKIAAAKTGLNLRHDVPEHVLAASLTNQMLVRKVIAEQKASALAGRQK